MIALVTIVLALVANKFVANGQSCSTPAGSGVCRYTTACPGAGGTSYAGYCPGPTNYQCCVPKSCSTPSGSGKCKPTSECSGTKIAGYCPGPSTTQCCITNTNTGDCSYSQAAGRTINNMCANQIRNAKTIISVGRNYNIPQYGWVIAIAAALVESRLVNVNFGDRDSLGLFQQRCSVGWCQCGSGSECLNTSLASRAFYGKASHTNNAGLTDISGWQQMSVRNAAQAVQRSCCPDRYGAQESFARQIVAKYA